MIVCTSPYVHNVALQFMKMQPRREWLPETFTKA